MHPAELRSAHQAMRDIIHRGDPSDPPFVLCCVEARERRLLVGIDVDASLSPGDAERWIGERMGGVPVRVEALRFHRHANKQQLNRPILGGIAITCPSSEGQGSISVVAQRPNGGERGFVTAGHTVESVDNVVYQPQRSQVNDWRVGVARVVSPYGTVASSDSAFVGLAPVPQPLPPLGQIWKSANSVYRVANVLRPSVYQVPVYMQGAYTAQQEQSGLIVSVWSTVRFFGGGVLHDQIIATYQSRPGDSGGPVYIPMSDNEHVHLLGINVGAASRDDIDPRPAPGTYGVCSPWQCIVDELGALEVMMDGAAAAAAEAAPPALEPIAARYGAPA